MAVQNQGDCFDEYFKRADLDRDGRISGDEAVAFLKGSNLPQHVLAQVWMYADQNRTGYLGRVEFYNALKLVTVAQSKQELTPDIVKTALYSPASARIPAPQINLPGISAPQSNAAAAASSAPQLGTVVSASHNPGFRGAPLPLTANVNQQFNQSPVTGSVRPPNAVHSVASRPVQRVGFQGFGEGGLSLGSNLANSEGSSGAVGTSTARGPLALMPGRGSSPSTTQAGLPSGTPGQMASLSPRPRMISGMTSSGTPLVQAKPPVLQNRIAPGSPFGGGAFSVTPSQTKQDGSMPTSAGGFPVSSALVPVSGGSSSKLGSLDSAPNSFTTQHVDGQPQKMEAPVKQSQQVPVQNIPSSGAYPPTSHSSAGHQNQLQWPRPTPTDLQKYIKVFMEVDTDKDGKITGEQARNLFLSWRLPREVLKQVWDLSDQDNDSMLSLGEFCIALYLMERYREGRPLPAVIPSSIMLDFPARSQRTGGYGLQPHAMTGTGARPPRPAAKPPLPVPAVPSDDRISPKQQKPEVPVLEKLLVDQLSEEEQKSLNLKFQEASEADKKVEELEKEIKESREKMEFYRVKMQELVLYKSRCDSHVNEISERAAADKREVESLAKKYEEKNRQAGDVASKLTIEEATFRDIQEKKMDMYQAIVKLEHDDDGEDLQARADRIQCNLEELVKSLSEHCKKYGLCAKPTTLLELPFGWQPGVEGGASDWDEVWDKFEDEGFAFVKELTLDVQNVIAPLRTRAKARRNEKNLTAEDEAAVPTPDAESKTVNSATEDERVAENGGIGNQKDDVLESSPVASSSARTSHANSVEVSKDNHLDKTVILDASPRGHGIQSDLGVADASSSGVKSFDEPAWGTFDTNDDNDSTFGSTKEIGRDRHTDDLFEHGEWTLPPIKTGSSLGGDFLPKMSIFADSVPGTPADGFLPKKSIFADSVPGTPADGYLPKNRIFADSVPRTPLYSSSYSPQKSGEGPEERVFYFSRFDSFTSTDSGFPPPERLSPFDSFCGTGEYDTQDGASFQQSEAFSRFDSIRSTKEYDYGQFSSFDDSDPFGSGPFKSFGSETPRREDAFGSSEPFRSSLGNETPQSEVDPVGYVDPFRSSLGSETPRVDADLDADPFGSVGPFRSSLGSETPRADADPFGSVGPFRSSMGSETPRRESDYFAHSDSFRSSFGSETPRGDFNSFGFNGPFASSSLGNKTPRQDSDACRSVGPFRASVSTETPKGRMDN